MGALQIYIDDDDDSIVALRHWHFTR